MMRRSTGSRPTPWGSLSLRLGALFIAALIGAAAAVGFLFDRGRAQALASHRLAQLRLPAERAADEVDRLLKRLGDDLGLLAQTPPIPEMAQALRNGGVDREGGSSLAQWKQRLSQTFLVFAAARPDYLRIRFSVPSGGVPELVAVERGAPGLEPAPSSEDSLEARGHDTESLGRSRSGSVHFSGFEIEPGPGVAETPPRVALDALTALPFPDGGLDGLLQVRMDLASALARAQALSEGSGSLLVVDEGGATLLPPSGDPAAVRAAWAALAANRAGPDPLVTRRGGQDAATGGLAYVTERQWDPGDPSRRLVFVLGQSEDQGLRDLAALRRGDLLAGGGLLLLATALVVLLVHRQTRSLSTLARALEKIARGDSQVALPAADGSEIGSLVRAFRHMAEEVRRREDALAALNQDLERRVAERTSELASEHELQRLILDSVADGVVVADREGRFLLWNRKAEQIVGSGPDAVPAERWSEHFGIYRDESGEPLPWEELPLVRALKGELIESTELYLRNPKGPEGQGRWAQVTARPLRDPNGGLAGAVAVMMDVTEKRRLQAGVEAHRTALGRFGRLYLGAEIVSTTAHQLSQPLGALCNYAGAALRLHRQGRLSDCDLDEMLERMEQLSVQAGAILDRLRARIRRTENPRTPFHVDAVVSSCLDFLGERIQREGVRLERRLDPGLPPLLGDPLELEHALIQLLVNALEAMEGIDRGARRLILSTALDPVAGRVIIEIADTGPGVSPALADRLFRPWETDKPGSLGIGLSIVNTVIESFGGEVRMEPEASGGTCFRIDLPAVRGEPV